MKHSIKITYQFNHFSIGIASNLKGYRLCSLINKTLKLNLSRHEDIEIEVNDNEIAQYSYFEYENELKKQKILLFENKSEYGPLIKERKEMDFILILKGILNYQAQQHFIDKINQISAVQIACKIEITSKQSIKNLIIE